MPYLIMPGDASNFEVDPTSLSLKLREHWPTTEITQDVPDAVALLEWKIIAGNINQIGALHSDKRTLTVDDDPAGVSEFAVWYKKVIAEKHDLFIYHDSDASLEVRVTSETKVTEIEGRLLN